VISGDTANKNIQYCNAKLNDNGNTLLKSALLNSNYYEVKSPIY
jgi:hypothetical protein